MKGETNKALKVIRDLLIARRQGQVMREQSAYNRLVIICRRNGWDFSDTLTRGSEHIRRTDVAAIMQGW
jgi:hypothetical protein